MNTNIEILLDKTAEYLLKYDASEEGQKCAHEIQDYYEYHPNYILGCLDYARKFAHKAQTIDIDEDPIEFMDVANKAYHAWASSMRMKNESISKKIVKLTESKLKQIVAESVRKVLSEGKLKNNVPLFRSPRHTWAKPGEYADPEQYDKLEKLFREEEPSLSKRNLVNSFIAKEREGLSKHNDRAEEKYEYDSDNSNIRDDKFKPLFGDEYVDDLYRKKQKDRKCFSQMLQYNGISLEDFKNSSEEQQHYYWMNYYHPNDGDPNWDDLINRAYGRPRYYDEY